MTAGPLTQVSDIVVPEIFTSYIQQITEEKARIIQSGVAQRSPMIDGFLAGGGLTFNVPSFQDLDNDADNVSTDAVSDAIAWTELNGTVVGANYPALNDSVPLKIQTATEVGVRLSRNNSWSSADLAAALAGTDPLSAIAARVGYYWTRRLQAAFIATWQGVSKDNAVNDAGDYVNDIAGANGTASSASTIFTAEAYLDAKLTMGDSMEVLGAIMVHSVVYNRMQKNNLIDFIPDARGETSIPTFLGAEVIVDDGMPSGTSAVYEDGSAAEAGVFESWLFGPGSTQLGVSTPKVATEVERKAAAGNGGGQEILFNRTEWSLHPVGHAYTGTAPNGGPANGAVTNGLNIATSWDRVYSERKQINFARLVTREF